MRQQVLAALAAVPFAAAAAPTDTPLATATAGAQLPLEHFTRHDEFGDVKISPDGEYLAMTAGRYGRSAIAFVRRSDRKVVGGAMRQAGVLAAAAIVALEQMVDRLAEDHANARLLAQALASCRGAQVAPVETNIVVATLEGRSAPDIVASLRTAGVLASAMDAQTLRLVTHRDVDRGDCERAAQAIERALA